MAEAPTPQANQEPDRHPRQWILPGLLALAGVVYGPLLLAGFAWDDQLLVIDLERRGAGWLQIFTSDLWAAQDGPGPSSSSYYRPLTSLDFALLHKLFGPSPMPFHGLSLVVHVVTAGLLYRLLDRCTDQAWAPALAVMIFLFHPLQQEAVGFVSARNDLWAGLACVLAASAWQSDKPRWAAVSLFVGLLFKETAVAILPMVVAWDLAAGRRDWLRRATLVAFPILPYAVLRILIAGVSSDPGGGGSLAGVIGYGGHWVGALALPLQVGPYRPMEPLIAAAWTGPALLAGATAAVLAVRWRPATAAGIAMATAALVLALPVSLDVGYTGDRYAYVALVGLALATPALVSGLPQRVVLALCVVLGGTCLALNTASLPRWSNHLALMEHGQQADPSGRASFELAKSLSSLGEYERALAAGRRAVSDPHPNLAAWPIVAAMELSLGNPQAALDALDDARAAGVPDQPRSLVNRAACLRHLGRDDEVYAVVSALVAMGEEESEVRARLDRIAPLPARPGTTKAPEDIPASER